MGMRCIVILDDFQADQCSYNAFPSIRNFRGVIVCGESLNNNRFISSGP